jgi:calcineurin-like phosphoesterase family protein
VQSYPEGKFMAESSIRWLHLSDFHAGRSQFGTGNLYDELRDLIKGYVQAGYPPDFIFITGDVAQSGKSNHYDEFIQNFNIYFSDRFDGHKIPVYIVPGNHDTDVENAPGVQAYDLLKMEPHFFDASPQGKQLRARITPRFESYIKAGISELGGEWLASEAGAFIEQVEIRGCRVGVVGINTAWVSQGEDDRYRLTPGRAIIERALERIRDCELRIVLGHHPLDWFTPEEEKAAHALFKKYNIIYLHGHLDKNHPYRNKDTTHLFLPLQAGVCFNPAPKDKWVNRILWCEAEPQEQKISVTPLHWVEVRQSWSVDNTAFPRRQRKDDRVHWEFPLPGITQLQMPAGWKVIDKREMDKHRVALSESDIIGFFDGRLPEWEYALAPQIPRRDGVGELVSKLKSSLNTGALGVTILLGAGGEGKSTLLQQTVCDLADSDAGWNILWHDNVNTPLPVEYLLELEESGQMWLIVSDDAHLIAQDVFDAVRVVHKPGRKYIHFLLSSRDTDWNAVEGSEDMYWDKFTDLDRVVVKGLTSKDAHTITEAWSKYDKRGMGLLYGLSPSQAADELFKAASSDEGGKYKMDGAFLGAMLDKRMGSGLKAHVKSILQRLKERPAPGGSLMDAFAYIAAIHAEGSPVLTKKILATTLGCAPRDIRPLVIGPLGQEAAALAIGDLILTRHRKIAETAVAILRDELNVDLDERFVELLKAARAVFDEDKTTKIGGWDYLASHFFKKDGNANKTLGIRLAETLVEAAPENGFFRTQLGSLLREAGDPERSMKLFFDSPKETRKERSIYIEWSVSADILGKHALGIWLSGVALADNSDMTPLNREKAKICLRNLAESLSRLFDTSKERIFIEASAGATQLGVLIPMTARTVSTEKSLQEYMKRYRELKLEDVEPPTAIQRLQTAITCAWEKRESALTEERLKQEALPPWVKQANELTFHDLEMIIGVNTAPDDFN